MKSKEELHNEIEKEILVIRKKSEGSMFSDEISDANNRIAIATLYLALSNLIR